MNEINKAESSMYVPGITTPGASRRADGTTLKIGL